MHEYPDAPLMTLAAHLGISASSVTRQADRLVREGHLTRTQLPENRRIVRLSLTARGQSTVTRILDRRTEAFTATVAALDPDVRPGLVRGLAARHVALAEAGS